MNRLKIQRPRSRTEEVTMLLRQEIVEGVFALGEALSESKIAARYDVSRTPVREAFSFLGKEGLVRTEPQQGTYVFTVDREDFSKLSETRAILEIAALRIALEHKRKTLRKGWRKLVKGMEAEKTKRAGQDYVRLDRSFHSLLFQLADNSYLTQTTQSFDAKMAAIQSRLSADEEHMEYSYAQHAELLQLVEEKRDQAAIELLDRHIRHKGESFWKAAEEQFAAVQSDLRATNDER